MSFYSAEVLYDAFWMVLIDEYGEQATAAQPAASRARFTDYDHAAICREAIALVHIGLGFAARAVGFKKLNIDEGVHHAR